MVLSFPDFLKMYEDYSTRRELHAYSEDGTLRKEARGNIASFWAIDQLSVRSRSLLQVLAILDPDCIPEKIVNQYAAQPGHLTDYPKSDWEYSSARGELLRTSLVERNQSRNEINMHRVVQDTVVAMMSKGELFAVFLAAAAMVKAAWGDTPLDKRHDWQLSKARASLFPHTECLKALYEKLYADTRFENCLEFAILMNEAAW